MYSFLFLLFFNIKLQSFIPGYNLELLVYDTKDTPSGTIIAAFQCAVVDKCVGVIGDAYSADSELVQYVLQNYSVCLFLCLGFFPFRATSSLFF